MTSAVIVAAGSSRRMGFDKLFAPLGRRPVLQHAIDAFQACEAVDAIILVGGPRVLETAEGWRMAGCDKLHAIVPGGEERHLSVQRGLAACPTGTDFVAVHDGARPLTHADDITATLTAARKHGAATLAHPITDTVKRVDDGNRIGAEVDRTGLWAMETPQVARMDWLSDALTTITDRGDLVTDEVSALRACGHPVHVVASTHPNPKITWPTDLVPAEKLLG